ncbi:MAG: TetR/AcrR family transcriptional regulator [Pseudomonadales bacterium]|nr:TetR/AcrR family transcriptional regulator [Pseudomonadales bacterium]
MTRKHTSGIRAGRPGATTREAIIQAAIELVIEGGESALSFRKIAGKLGVSAPSLYSYFEDKQAILAALSSQLFHIDLKTEARQTPRKQLETLLCRIRNSLLQNSKLLFLLNKSLPAEQMLKVLAALAEPVEKSGISHGQSIRHAQSLLWMVLGFSMFEYNSQQAVVVNRFLELNKKESDLLTHLELSNHDRLWKETLKRNLDGLIPA